MKHSPGPWEFSEEMSAVYSANGKRVADLECDEDDLTDEEIVVNGMVIAAVPDLLIALKDCVTQMERTMKSVLAPAHQDPFLNALLGARNQISKLKG